MAAKSDKSLPEAKPEKPEKPTRVQNSEATNKKNDVRKCLRKFLVAPGVSMMDVVTEERCEIYKGNKRTHFANLQKKTGLPYNKMCFFDDDEMNIRDVGTLGVHCFYTPDGVTRGLFEQGLKAVGASEWASHKPP